MAHLDIFCQDAQGYIDTLRRELLLLERNPGRVNILRDLRQNAHTLETAARGAGLTEVSLVAQMIAEQLREIEEGRRQINTAAIDLLVEGVHAVAKITSALSKGEAPQLDVHRFISHYQYDASLPVATGAESATWTGQ